MDLLDGRLRGLERELEELRTARQLALGRAALLEQMLGRERSRTRVLREVVHELQAQLEEFELDQVYEAALD